MVVKAPAAAAPTRKRNTTHST